MINRASCARQMGAGWHGSVIQMGTFFLSFSIQNRERLMRLGVLNLVAHNRSLRTELVRNTLPPLARMCLTERHTQI